MISGYPYLFSVITRLLYSAIYLTATLLSITFIFTALLRYCMLVVVCLHLSFLSNAHSLMH